MSHLEADQARAAYPNYELALAAELEAAYPSGATTWTRSRRAQRRRFGHRRRGLDRRHRLGRAGAAGAGTPDRIGGSPRGRPPGSPRWTRPRRCSPTACATSGTRCVRPARSVPGSWCGCTGRGRACCCGATPVGRCTSARPLPAPPPRCPRGPPGRPAGVQLPRCAGRRDGHGRVGARKPRLRAGGPPGRPTFPAHERAGAIFAWITDTGAEPAPLELPEQVGSDEWESFLCYVEWDAPYQPRWTT